MVKFIEEYYKLIAGIIVPIIVALIGIFKIRNMVKKHYSIKDNNNKMLIADRDVNSNQSFNTVNQGSDSIQVAGNNNQIVNFDVQAVQVLAQSFNR